MARRHSLYLVANMASLLPCPAGTDPPTCPPDGRWQFNTDVVFRCCCFNASCRWESLILRNGVLTFILFISLFVYLFIQF